MNRRLSSPTKTLVDDARAALESCAGLNSRLAARRITQFLEKRMTSNFGMLYDGFWTSSPKLARTTGGPISCR